MYSPKCMWDRGTKQGSDRAFTVSRSEQQITLRYNSASSMSVSNSVAVLIHEARYFVIVGVIRFLHTVYSRVQCPQTRANETIHLYTVYCRTVAWTMNDEREMTRTVRVLVCGIISAFVASGWEFHLFTQGSTRFPKILKPLQTVGIRRVTFISILRTNTC